MNVSEDTVMKKVNLNNINVSGVRNSLRGGVFRSVWPAMQYCLGATVWGEDQPFCCQSKMKRPEWQTWQRVGVCKVEKQWGGTEGGLLTPCSEGGRDGGRVTRRNGLSWAGSGLQESISCQGEGNGCTANYYLFHHEWGEGWGGGSLHITLNFAQFCTYLYILPSSARCVKGNNGCTADNNLFLTQSYIA